MAFCDSALAACKVSGKASTGVLVFANQTPVDWCAKLQKPTKTVVCGAEFSAARTGTEKLMDILATLRAVGVPLDGEAWSLGDNESVVTSSTIPHSVLGKRHNFLSCHHVRAAVARKVMKFCHVRTHQNIADILTKFLGNKAFVPFTGPSLFKSGDTAFKTAKKKQRFKLVAQ